MGTLRVFSTEGEQLHPAGAAEFTSRYSNYFTRVYLKAELGGEAESLEVYVRVRTERQKEQVYLRYDATDDEDLFEGCRSAVRAELVEQRNWRFLETSKVEPSGLFHALVGTDESRSPPSIQDETLAERESTIRSHLESGDGGLTLHGRNYSILAGLVEKFADANATIVVVGEPSEQALAI